MKKAIPDMFRHVGNEAVHKASAMLKKRKNSP